MSYSNYECLIQINGTGISGASIANISQNQDVEVFKGLGKGYLGCAPKGYSTVQFSITKPLCISGGDPFKYLTGDVSCSGAIRVGSSGLAFTSGYLTKYGVNYSLEEAPNATLDFVVYGPSSWTSLPDAAPMNGPFYFAKLGYVDMDLSGFIGITTDFSYSIAVPRKPFFSFGSLHPTAVKTIDPRELTISAKGYVTQSPPHYAPNLYHSSGVMDYFDFSVMTYGGTGDILLDSQTGRVNIETNEVSISIDDELEFSFGLRVCF